MSYPTGTPITYTAVASTPGFSEADHSYTWAFDDGGVGAVSSVSHIWSVTGDRNAIVTAKNKITGATAIAAKSVPIDSYTVTQSVGTPPDNKGICTALLPSGRLLSIGGLNRVSSAQTFLAYEFDGSAWSRVGDTYYGHTNSNQNMPVIYPVLPNGKVLVCGNSASGGAVELYDPVSKTFSPTGDMRYPVQDACHPVVLLDGRVFVPEGLSGGLGIGASQIYTPGTGLWTAAVGSGFTSEGVTSPVVLLDGRVFYGIYGSTRYLAYIYNPANNTVQTFGTSGKDIGATALGSDGNVYCYTYGTTEAFRRFNVVGGTFTTLAAGSDAPTAGNGISLKAVFGGRYIVAFGVLKNSVRGTNTYDVASQAWLGWAATPNATFFSQSKDLAFAPYSGKQIIWGSSSTNAGPYVFNGV